MQQTEKYKLNLIERSDVFSPDALNENMEKVEAQLGAVRAEAAAGDAAVTAAFQSADAAEAQARANADAAVTAAFQSADAAEAQARANAVSAEAQARANAVSAEAQTRAAADSALSQRVSTLELHKMVVGYHAGSGTVYLGFTPSVVLIVNVNGIGLVIQNHAVAGLRIVEGGFEHSSTHHSCYYAALI